MLQLPRVWDTAFLQALLTCSSVHTVGSVLAAPQCCTTSCRTSATCIISNVCVWGGGGRMLN